MSSNISERDTILDLPESVEKIIDGQLTVLKSFSTIAIGKNELIMKMTPELIEEENKAKIEKFIFLYYAKQLRDNPKLQYKYDSDKIPEGLWQPLTRLLAAIRVKELKDVKIIRRKGKYDIKELRNSYFGDKILADLTELGSRWMLSASEFKQVQLQCRKLELELPTVVEPTTTEKFFDDD